MKQLVRRQYKDQVWFEAVDVGVKRHELTITMGKTHGTRQAPRGLEDGSNNTEVHGRPVGEADRL